VLWLLLAVGAAELVERAGEILWPQLRDARFRFAASALGFVLAGAFVGLMGVNIFESVPRPWPQEALIGASAVFAAFLFVPMHAGISILMAGAIDFTSGGRRRRYSAKDPMGFRNTDPRPTADHSVHCGHSADVRPETIVAHLRDVHSDASIAALQMSLRARGFLGRRYLRGVYCEATDEAVAAYQRFHGLVEDA